MRLTRRWSFPQELGGSAFGKIVVLVIGTTVSACTLGPDYERPGAPTPIVYKELQGWKI